MLDGYAHAYPPGPAVASRRGGRGFDQGRSRRAEALPGDEFIEASYRMQEAAHALQDHATVMHEFGSGALTMQDLVGIMARSSEAMQKLEQHQDLLGNFTGGMGW
jgi:hypothetical protein